MYDQHGGKNFFYSHRASFTIDQLKHATKLGPFLRFQFLQSLRWRDASVVPSADLIRRSPVYTCGVGSFFDLISSQLLNSYLCPAPSAVSVIFVEF